MILVSMLYVTKIRCSFITDVAVRNRSLRSKKEMDLGRQPKPLLSCDLRNVSMSSDF